MLNHLSKSTFILLSKNTYENLVNYDITNNTPTEISSK